MKLTNIKFKDRVKSYKRALYDSSLLGVIRSFLKSNWWQLRFLQTILVFVIAHRSRYFGKCLIEFCYKRSQLLWLVLI